MSEAARQKLARQRRMRVLHGDGSELKRVALSTLLPEGARLLIPKDSAAKHEQHESDRSSAETAHDAGSVPEHVRQLEAKLAEQMQRRVLHSDGELLVLNKPAGLPVQGGDRIHVSLDSLLPHLRLGSAENPRLVHRLDRNTSGALVIARTADAATWLSRAFRAPAQSLQPTAAAGQPPPPSRGVPSVEKHYHAVVEDSPGLQDRGLISGQMPGGSGRDASQRAVTKYEVLARSGGGFAWLALQPVTGRKHQLRQHCAELGAPVVGDGRYGRTRSSAQQRLRQLLADTLAPDQDAREAELDRLLRCNSHLLLHCFRVVIQKSAEQCIDVVAPPSQHMRRVLDLLFPGARGAAYDSRAEGTASRPAQVRSLSSELLSDVPQSGHHSPLEQNSGSMPRTQHKRSQRTVIGHADEGKSTGTHTFVQPRKSDREGRLQTGGSASPAGSSRESQADNPACHRQMTEQDEMEPELKQRWSWARKRAVRVEREKVADVKREKKKEKMARKNKRGHQRAARRRHGVMRPFVALDI